MKEHLVLSNQFVEYMSATNSEKSVAILIVTLLKWIVCRNIRICTMLFVYKYSSFVWDLATFNDLTPHWWSTTHDECIIFGKY